MSPLQSGLIDSVPATAAVPVANDRKCFRSRYTQRRNAHPWITALSINVGSNAV